MAAASELGGRLRRQADRNSTDMAFGRARALASGPIARALNLLMKHAGVCPLLAISRAREAAPRSWPSRGPGRRRVLFDLIGGGGGRGVRARRSASPPGRSQQHGHGVRLPALCHFPARARRRRAAPRILAEPGAGPPPMSLMDPVSRVTPVHTAMRNCTGDEGRSFEVGNQVLISSHHKLLSSKDAMGPATRQL